MDDTDIFGSHNFFLPAMQAFYFNLEYIDEDQKSEVPNV